MCTYNICRDMLCKKSRIVQNIIFPRKNGQVRAQRAVPSKLHPANVELSVVYAGDLSAPEDLAREKGIRPVRRMKRFCLFRLARVISTDVFAAVKT